MTGGQTIFEGELLADYRQIYVQDAERGADALPVQWTDAHVEQWLNPAPHGLILQTARNMIVPFRVVLDGEPPVLDLNRHDHVVECGIAVPSGMLLIAGLSDYAPTAARRALSPGSWRALAVFDGLGTLSADGLEGADRYALLLWAEPDAEKTPLRVLKQWKG